MIPEYLQEGAEEMEVYETTSLYAKKIRAGRRTYYIDVKRTRSEDLYLSISEMRRTVTSSGALSNERKKIHIYEEDIEKFAENINEALKFIKLSARRAPSKK